MSSQCLSHIGRKVCEFVLSKFIAIDLAMVLRNFSAHLRRNECDAWRVHSATRQAIGSLFVWNSVASLAVAFGFCCSAFSSVSVAPVSNSVRLAVVGGGADKRFLYDAQLARRSTCRKHASHRQLSTVSFSSSESEAGEAGMGRDSKFSMFCKQLSQNGGAEAAREGTHCRGFSFDDRPI